MPASERIFIFPHTFYLTLIKQTASCIAEAEQLPVYVLDHLQHAFDGSVQGLMWYKGWREDHEQYDSDEL